MAAGKKKEGGPFSDMSVDELIQKRNEIITLLQTLEDEHLSASISDESYKSAKGGNQKKLDQIRTVLSEFGIGDNDGKLPEKKKAEKPQATHTESVAPPSEPGAPDSAAHPVAVPVAAIGSPVSESVILEKAESKISGEMEKVHIIIDAVKEGQAAADERMQRLTESIGELRSMIFNADSSVKSDESRLEIIEEHLGEVDPKKVEKEFMRRDKAIGDHDLRIEKAERKLGDTLAIVKDLQGIITSVGGLHNIADIDQEITKKLEEIRETSKEISRTADRFEKMFVELNKRMDEFFVYRAKQESLDEIVRDVIKSIDTLNNRIESVATKESLFALRESFKSFETELDKLGTKVSRAVPYADLVLPKELQEMSAERDSIMMLMSSLEDEEKVGRLTKEAYLRARDGNAKKLADIESRMRESLSNLKAPDSRPASVPVAVQAVPAAPAPTTPTEPAQKKEEPEKPTPQASPAPAGISEPKPAPHNEEHAQKSKAPPAESKATKKEEIESIKEHVLSKPAEPEREAQKTGGAPAPAAPSGKKARLLIPLEESFKSGGISRQAYEHAKGLIMKMAE